MTARAKALRKMLTKALAAHGVSPTDQARESLIQSLTLVPDELASHSDGILTGLLHSGSYTVDVVESAGVSAARLRDLALRSTQWGGVELDDPVDDLISWGSPVAAAIEEARSDDSVLETRHLLKAALSPRTIDPKDTDRLFPFSARRDRPAQAGLLRDMEHATADLISYATAIIHDKGDVVNILSSRHSPINPKEDWKLDRFFGVNSRGMTTPELDYIIAAANAWFVHRRILTDPADLCMSVVARTSSLSFASRIFASEGGNLKAVEYGLRTAERFSPERDMPSFAMFEQNGRIHVGEYTYRNTFMSNGGLEVPYHRVSFQAVRPAPLVSPTSLRLFEEILSDQWVREGSIRNFLCSHPELLEALGYQSIHPHICLTSDDPQAERGLVPNFLLRLPGLGGFDMLDLTLPRLPILVRDPRARVSAHILRAVAQLREYAKFFDVPQNRRTFVAKYGLEAFRPRLIMLIGRDAQFYTRDERLEIEEQMKDVRLLTYDDLIAYGNSRSLLLRTEATPARTIRRHYEQTRPGDADHYEVNSVLHGLPQRVEHDMTVSNNIKDHDSEFWRSTANNSTIGIITALPKEAAALLAALDAVGTTTRGGHAYDVGLAPGIDGTHGVVHATSIGMGNTAAAVVGTQMFGHFPNLQHIVMVGIAGMVPDPADAYRHARLGDVVVSSMKGVIEFDYRKEGDGWEEVRCAPTRPAARLLDAVVRLQRKEEDGTPPETRPWFTPIATISRKVRITRPAEHTDVLHSDDEPFGPIDHPVDPLRHVGVPRVHIAPIASSGTLLKNPKRRDQLGRQFGVRAVEMEGAGVSEAAWAGERGYLVVRGGCDYCDKFKSDEWQKYAAVVAAAYLCALLRELPVT